MSFNPQQNNQNNQSQFMTPYLQKVSNRNPNAKVPPQQHAQGNLSAPPLNPSSIPNAQSSGTPANQSSNPTSSIFSSSQSIWKNTPESSGLNLNGDNSFVTERPKRATFGNPTQRQSNTGNHRRSLSGGGAIPTRQPNVQSRANFPGSKRSLSHSSSTEQLHSYTSRSAPASGTGSFSHSSTGSESGDDSEDRFENLSLMGSNLDDYGSYAFSTSPNSSTNSVMSSSSHSSTGSHFGAFSSSSRGSGNIMSYVDYTRDQSNLMRIPENNLSTSPTYNYNPHVATLESPPKHSSNAASYGISSYTTGSLSTASYGQFSSSPSSFSQFSGPWGNANYNTNRENQPYLSQQPQPLGANLHLYHHPSSPQQPQQNQYNQQQQSQQRPGQYQSSAAINTPSISTDRQQQQQSQQSFYSQDMNTSPGTYFGNGIQPRYSTTPSSPTGNRRVKPKAHSTPSSPAGTPNPSPPREYGRKVRSCNPSPQKSRPSSNSKNTPWGVSQGGKSPSKHRNKSKNRSRKREESAGAKQKYKEFSKKMKEMGFAEAKRKAEKEFKSFPSEIRWRVCMDLADLAKRENLLDDARYWFKQVNGLQPSAAQGWLEFAKLEEECGNVEQCHKLLMKGLQHCQQNESLLIKAVKFYENINKIECAREILGRLRFMTLEKNWKIFLEGALLESRDGNVKMARDIFKTLMHKVKRHGPIYFEAYKLEEKCEEYERAIDIVKRGLDQNPRYGPLWFSYLHLLEREATRKSVKESKTVDLTPVRDAVKEAVKTISGELIWKVYFEAAHIEERANEIDRARSMYARSVVNCLKNLRWKVWLAGARTELNAGKHQVARDLLNRALKEVPNKTRAQVLIECARLEEYYGNIDKARDFLNRAKQEARHEWKVFLESILLEMRANNIRDAIREAVEALEIHRGTGRLWAVLIQLKQCDGPDEQIKIFKQALREVPKSGEVWCEGGRIRLNPLSPKFNLAKARDYLNFAIKFTPQYGDSFIEYLRLELLSKGPRLEEEDKLYLEQLCVNADPNYGPLWFFCKTCPTDSTRSVLRRAKTLLRQELTKYQVPYQRAILRYACKSVSNKIEADPKYSSEDFTMSLQSLTEADDEETRKKRIFGCDFLCA